MYAVLSYLSGSDRANLLSDIVAIITGETNTANLSANCDAANTTISAAIAVAGWSVYDAAASADSQVLRAAHHDNASSYKLAEIVLDASLNLDMRAYEDWNSTTHTGTNQSGNSITQYEQRVQSGAAGKLYIWATARFIAIFGTDASNGGDEASSGPTILAEHSRIPPWNTSSNGVPSFALVHAGPAFSGSATCWPVRAKDISGVDKIGSTAAAYLTSIGVSYNDWQSGTYFPSGPDNNIPDGLGANFTPFFPLYIYKPQTYGTPLGDISSICDVWVAPKSLLGSLEVVTQNGVDYIACQGNSNGMSVLFPNG